MRNRRLTRRGRMIVSNASRSTAPSSVAPTTPMTHRMPGKPIAQRYLWAMALALRARIFVGFGIALLLLGVVSWFSYQNAANTVASARWVAHTREVLETLDAL